MAQLRAAWAVVALTVLAGCGGGADANACRVAAIAQAEAEQAWGLAIEDHNTAHEQLEHSGNTDTASFENHLELEDRLTATRVDLIVATESTRQACG